MHPELALMQTRLRHDEVEAAARRRTLFHPAAGPSHQPSRRRVWLRNPDLGRFQS